MNVFRILGGILFYIKMYLGSLLVNYFGNVEPLLYIIGQVLGYQKHPGSEGDWARHFKVSMSLFRANQLLPLS